MRMAKARACACGRLVTESRDTQPERTAAMEQAYLEGATMLQLAGRYGLSKTRVEQLLRPAREAGRIPPELREARRAAARKAQAERPERRAAFAKAQAARWGEKGYSDAFKRLVAQAARVTGVLPTSREWGVHENTVRRWRDEIDSSANRPFWERRP